MYHRDASNIARIQCVCYHKTERFQASYRHVGIYSYIRQNNRFTRRNFTWLRE